MGSKRKYTTAPDGTTVTPGTVIIRGSDGDAFRIVEIDKEEGKGVWGKVTLTLRSVNDRSILAISRQDLEGFQVDLSTVVIADYEHMSDLDEKFLADPDGYMQKREDEEVEGLNFRFQHDILYPGDVDRAKALGLEWAETYVDPSQH